MRLSLPALLLGLEIGGGGCGPIAYDLDHPLSVQFDSSISSPAVQGVIEQAVLNAAASLGTSTAGDGQVIRFRNDTPCSTDGDEGAYVKPSDNTVVRFCQDPASLDDMPGHLLLITMHEIGHVLGAVHIAFCNDSIMYPTPDDPMCGLTALEKANLTPTLVRYSFQDTQDICNATSGGACGY